MKNKDDKSYSFIVLLCFAVYLQMEVKVMKLLDKWKETLDRYWRMEEESTEGRLFFCHNNAKFFLCNDPDYFQRKEF